MGELYVKQGDEWVPVVKSGTQQGPPGPAGPVGPVGPAGDPALLTQFSSFGTFCWSNNTGSAGSQNVTRSTFTNNVLPTGTWVVMYNVWQAADGGGEDDNRWWPNKAISVLKNGGFNLDLIRQSETPIGSWLGNIWCGQGFCFKIASV